MTSLCQAMRVTMLGLTALGLVATSSTAQAQPIEPHQQTLRIKHKSGGETKEFCDDIVRSLRHQITAHQFFDVVIQGNSSFDLDVLCEKDLIRGALTYTAGGSRNTALGNFDIDLRLETTRDPAPMALRMLRLIKDGLPWDGFIFSATPLGKDAASLGRSTKKYAGYSAVIGEGTLTDPFMAHCLPVDVGRIDDKGEFRRIGYGITVFIGTFGSASEIYVLRKVKDAKTVVFRYSAPASLSKTHRVMVEECKENGKLIAEQSFFSFAALPSFDLLRKEAIELNSVRQHGGVSLLALKTTQGVKVPWALVSYANNRIKIGDLLAIDAKVMRHVYTSQYNPSPGYPPTLTLAQGFLSMRWEFAAFHELALGVGLDLDKINVPTTRGDMRYERRSHNRAAFKLFYAYEWPEAWVASHLDLSFGKEAPYKSFSIDANYMLTKTWYIGSYGGYTSYANTSTGDAGVSFFSIGGHMGFALERDR